VTDTRIDPESIDGSFAPQRNVAVQLVPVGSEAILVDGASGLHILNATASLLWECFDGSVTLSELADEIATEMEVPRDQVLEGTILIAQDFVARGIVSDARAPVVEPTDISSDKETASAVPTEPLPAPAPVTGPRVLADPPNA
jgi:hypothetical protein